MKKYILPVILLIFNIFIWQAVSASNDKLIVAFLNVGQGDAIYIESPTGNQVLIDSGSNRSITKALSDVMPVYDRSIDMIIATHPDKDHIGGFPEILERFDVSIVMESGNESDSGVYKIFKELYQKEEAQHLIARRGMVFNLGGGVSITILFPDRNVSGIDANDASIVLMLEHGENTFLLTGDSPIKMEEYLMSNTNLDADVLKVGHHGSKTSTSEEFVKAVSPNYAVISVGKDNKYGHPNKEVIDKLEGIEILYTYNGSVVFKSDRKTLKLP